MTTTPELPVRGTITSWLPDDSIGRIRLSSGEEIRFGHSACVGLRPSIGAEVWVVELAPHPLPFLGLGLLAGLLVGLAPFAVPSLGARMDLLVDRLPLGVGDVASVAFGDLGPVADPAAGDELADA